MRSNHFWPGLQVYEWEMGNLMLQGKPVRDQRPTHRGVGILIVTSFYYPCKIDSESHWDPAETPGTCQDLSWIPPKWHIFLAGYFLGKIPIMYPAEESVLASEYWYPSEKNSGIFCRPTLSTAPQCLFLKTNLIVSFLKKAFL